MSTGRKILLVLGGLLIGSGLTRLFDAARFHLSRDDATAARINADLLRLYVAFVRSEYDLPDCGPCEMFSRAQATRWTVPEFCGFASIPGQDEECAILRSGVEHSVAIPKSKFISKWRGHGGVIVETDRALDQASSNQ